MKQSIRHRFCKKLGSFSEQVSTKPTTTHDDESCFPAPFLRASNTKRPKELMHEQNTLICTKIRKRNINELYEVRSKELHAFLSTSKYLLEISILYDS